ncbi:MAG: phosphoglucomutase/phosphomannomutase family protein [Actinomycetota bacterium]|nr:phosphoglucomutase/phosphomannomutase family protein [Actinomycetota bacterium]
MSKTIKFGTDGWRAVMCDEFTFENVRLVVWAIANYLKGEGRGERGIVIGYDRRFLSEEFASVAASVLMGNSIPVKVMGEPAPTPMVAHAITLLKADGALMFTASHNPAKYNGIKFIPDYAGPASPEITKSIEEELDKVALSGEVFLKEEKGPELYSTIDTTTQYIEHIAGLIDLKTIKKSGLRLAFDPMFGAGAGPMKRLLEMTGSKLTSIHEERDPLFGLRLPEPSAENLQELISLVKDNGLDVGLALDGDGDRYGIIADDASFISANQVLSILTLHLLRYRHMRGRIVRTVATTHLIDEMAKREGAEVTETPVGFKYIAAEMLKGDVLIGGEESGGLSIQGHIPEKDGLLACLLILELLAKRGKPLSKIIEEVHDEFGVFNNARLDLCMDRGEIHSILEELKSSPTKEFAGQKVEKVILLDGIKLIMEDGSWVLLRASGTEPLVRIYIESRFIDSYNKLRGAAAKIFKA